jgi:hypothetical protein
VAEGGDAVAVDSRHRAGAGKRDVAGGERDGDVLLSNEGLTWCRGWDGPAAEAFRTACAL